MQDNYFQPLTFGMTVLLSKTFYRVKGSFFNQISTFDHLYLPKNEIKEDHFKRS